MVEPLRDWMRLLVIAALCCGLAPRARADADALKGRHAALSAQLARSPFGRPVMLDSTETSSDVSGEVFAVSEHGFASVQTALKQSGSWCEVLILHLNVKQCSAGPQSIAMSLGKKHDQPVQDAYRLDFRYRVAAQTADYLRIELHSDKGPFGTGNYRIGFEAAPIDATHTFIHMSYAYSYGMVARLAMQGYLATLGSGKVGFTVVERKADGEVVWIDNVRGLIERNTMRYYLAIDAYLESLSMPPAEQLDKRLHNWFAATERFPRQLHEMELDDYVAMKRREIGRQR